jgi:hypothetical protein
MNRQVDKSVDMTSINGNCISKDSSIDEIMLFSTLILRKYFLSLLLVPVLYSLLPLSHQFARYLSRLIPSRPSITTFVH